MHSTGAKIVLTCRSGAYDITLPKSEVFEICSLNNIQTKKFVGKWLDNDKIETNIFLKQLADSPFSDTAIRPLTLAHLCALYKKYKRIPAYPKSVYKRIVALLLEDWDIQRGIARASSFADFEIDRKLEFLYALSYGLSTQTGSKVFSEDALIDIFNKIHNNFGINKNERKKVIKELESQTGLLVKSSYDTYEFAHASIQEYLTAEYIVRLPKVYQFDVYTKSLMDELAITICLSSNPTVYFATLVTDTFANASFDQNQIARFLRRLKLENPDFSKESLTAVGLLSIYTKFFTTIVNQEALEVSDISVSQTFWKAMIMKNKVKEAFQDFNKMYYVVNKKNGVLVFNLDLLQVKTGFNYPNQLFMNQKLYELIYKKSNRPHQH